VNNVFTAGNYSHLSAVSYSFLPSYPVSYSILTAVGVRIWIKIIILFEDRILVNNEIPLSVNDDVMNIIYFILYVSFKH